MLLDFDFTRQLATTEFVFDTVLAFTMAALASTIRAAAVPPDDAVLAAKVREYLDTAYPDLASLAGPSRLTKRTLAEDIAHWESREADARASLAAAEAALPGAIEAARKALLDVLERAKQLTLERFELSDAIASLFSELDSSVPRPDDDVEGETSRERVPTLLEKVEVIHGNIAKAEAALAWSSVLERVLKQRLVLGHGGADSLVMQCWIRRTTTPLHLQLCPASESWRLQWRIWSARSLQAWR